MSEVVSAPQMEGDTLRELKGVRRTAAKHMVGAWSAPAFHLSIDVDMTAAEQAKADARGATMTDVLIRAVASALSQHPAVNSRYEGDFAVRRVSAVNIGIAVAAQGGLTVPVVRDAATLTLEQISERRRDLVSRARDGGLRREDIVDGSFTISNLGMLGIAEFDAILNVPQVAILAVAATRPQYVMTPSGPAWRPISRLTLTCDHRALDGTDGAKFLSTLKANIEGNDDTH